MVLLSLKTFMKMNLCNCIFSLAKSSKGILIVIQPVCGRGAASSDLVPIANLYGSLLDHEHAEHGPASSQPSEVFLTLVGFASSGPNWRQKRRVQYDDILGYSRAPSPGFLSEPAYRPACQPRPKRMRFTDRAASFAPSQNLQIADEPAHLPQPINFNQLRNLSSPAVHATHKIQGQAHDQSGCPAGGWGSYEGISIQRDLQPNTDWPPCLQLPAHLNTHLDRQMGALAPAMPRMALVVHRIT